MLNVDWRKENSYWLSRVVQEMCCTHLWEGKVRCRECWVMDQERCYPAKAQLKPSVPHTIKLGDMAGMGTVT